MNYELRIANWGVVSCFSVDSLACPPRARQRSDPAKGMWHSRPGCVHLLRSPFSHYPPETQNADPCCRRCYTVSPRIQTQPGRLCHILLGVTSESLCFSALFAFFCGKKRK